MTDDAPYWKRKRLEEMTAEEWEALCDGCGQCCLHKLEDVDTGEIALTNVACRYLDLGSCRCGDYANRKTNVPDCVQLTPRNARTLSWLPETCAYRLVAERKDLAWWHPLVSRSADTVHEAGISVRGTAISEDRVQDVQDHVTQWLNDRVAVDDDPFERVPEPPRRRPRRRRSASGSRGAGGRR